jgi:hypothetical protein
MEMLSLFKAPTVDRFAERMRAALGDGPATTSRLLRCVAAGVARDERRGFGAAERRLACRAAVAPSPSRCWHSSSLRCRRLVALAPVIRQGRQIVVGQSAGGAADSIARLIAESLFGLWQQAVTVENKGGAARTIAADLIAAPADGYSLLLGGQGSRHRGDAESALRYDPSRDFAPIGRLARRRSLVISAGVPAGRCELVAYAKAHPGKLTYIHTVMDQSAGSPSNG